MKKLTIFIVLFLILPSISAISIDLKPSYLSGETIIAKISGNFIGSISSDNVIFYRGYTKIPIQTVVSKLGDNYYIYAQTFGKQPGNYSINLHEIQYFQQGLVKNDDYFQNFSISNSNADFYINPAVISTKGPFKINIQNLLSSDLSIDIYENEVPVNDSSEEPSFFDLLFGTSSIPQEETTRTEIIPGDVAKDILFNLTKSNQTDVKFIQLKSNNINYTIPVELIVTEEEKIIPLKHLIFSPNILNFSMSTNSNTTRIIYLYNDGNLDLENISFILDDSLIPYVTLDSDKIDNLKENKSIKLTLKFSSDDQEKNFSGAIKANYSNNYAYLEIFTNFIKDYIPTIEDNQTIFDPAENVLKCQEQNGTICQEGYVCTGDIEPASDGLCCFDSCVEENKSGSGNKLLGWLILIVIGAALIWFFKTKYPKK